MLWFNFTHGTIWCFSLIFALFLSGNINVCESKEDTKDIPANSHACRLKTSISLRLMFAGQFLTPDWKMWVFTVFLDTISKNMLTQTHVRKEHHV